jgi:hypothetical protein
LLNVTRSALSGTKAAAKSAPAENTDEHLLRLRSHWPASLKLAAQSCPWHDSAPRDDSRGRWPACACACAISAAEVADQRAGSSAKATDIVHYLENFFLHQSPRVELVEPRTTRIRGISRTLRRTGYIRSGPPYGDALPYLPHTFGSHVADTSPILANWPEISRCIPGTLDGPSFDRRDSTMELEGVVHVFSAVHAGMRRPLIA